MAAPRDSDDQMLRYHSRGRPHDGEHDHNALIAHLRRSATEAQVSLRFEHELKFTLESELEFASELESGFEVEFGFVLAVGCWLLVMA